MDHGRFVIFGTGGLARELTTWLESCGRTVEGYVTTAPEQHGKYGLPGSILDEGRPSNTPGLIAIGDPMVKQTVFERASTNGWRFGSFVHPSALLGARVALAPGTFIGPNCTLSIDIRIGLCSFVNFGCGVGHDVTIDDFVQINPGVQIGGNCKIGRNTLVGSGTTIIEATAVGQYCVIGSGSVIYGQVRDGAHMIAALSRRARAFEKGQG